MEFRKPKFYTLHHVYHGKFSLPQPDDQPSDGRQVAYIPSYIIRKEDNRDIYIQFPESIQKMIIDVRGLIGERARPGIVDQDPDPRGSFYCIWTLANKRARDEGKPKVPDREFHYTLLEVVFWYEKARADRANESFRITREEMWKLDDDEDEFYPGQLIRALGEAVEEWEKWVYQQEGTHQ